VPEPWTEGVETVVVDGNNVVGAAADGWWRDRPAAVRRLVDRLRCYQRSRPVVVYLVLDVRQPDLPEGVHDGIEVRYPDRPGRNAADGRIVTLLDALADSPERGDGRVGVVTSDRALASEARERGATVLGAGRFLTHLSESGC
jgi:predicted RNA-binding protein with PIN domain